ncbi:hypothetical protein ACI2JA_08735 [Alkalihalobacillus sp. NPDC078783]
MNRKMVLMISPALIAFVSLLLISGFSLSAFIGSFVMGLSFFALALALLSEQQKEIVKVDEIPAEEIDEVKIY